MVVNLEELRQEYAKINLLDPSSPTYKRLVDRLDKLDTPSLQILADAQIKWISMLARNRIIFRAMSTK